MSYKGASELEVHHVAVQECTGKLQKGSRAKGGDAAGETGSFDETLWRSVASSLTVNL